jgi:hypothetical protein
MPTEPFVQGPHVPRRIQGGVHQLIERRDWYKYEGSSEAIRNERDGLVANEAWDPKKISLNNNCWTRVKSIILEP